MKICSSIAGYCPTKLVLMGKNWVTCAYLLADGTSLKFNQTPEKVVVKLPSSAPDPIASVVVLEID